MDTNTSPEIDASNSRRKRIEELKKSLTSGSNTATSPAVSTTDETAATSETAAATPDNSPAPADTSETSATPATAPAAPDAAPETTTDTEAPAVNETAPAETTLATAASSATAPLAPISSVPVDYLRGGYYRGEGKARYPDPALVDDAETIGKALAGCGVTPTAFNRMVKTLKGAAKLPLPGQQGAMKKLLPLALKEKKPLLRELVEKNRAAVQNEADFAACLDHMQDIAIFLAAATQTTK